MSFETFIESWEPVNAVDPSSLVEARLTAHWAAQIIGGVGEALVTPEPDFSHTSMTWSDELRDNTLGASPVRCWPHHFDIATLVALDPPGTDSEIARSIGFGLSPGDSSYAKPYFYINPWPFPDRREGHGALAGGGRWHTEGWFGAVLPASSVEGSGRAQAEQALAYAKSAMAANRVILGTL